jgi:hypothetical protein
MNLWQGIALLWACEQIFWHDNGKCSFLTTLVKQPWREMQPREMKSLGIPWRRQNNIKMDPTETGWNLMHWIIWLGIQDSDLFSWNRSWAPGSHKTWREFLGYIKTITFPRKPCFMDLMNYPLAVSPDRYTPQPQLRSLTWTVFYDVHYACLDIAEHLRQSWKLKLGIGLCLYEEQWLVTARLRIQAFLARAVALSSTAEHSINTAFFFPKEF